MKTFFLSLTALLAVMFTGCGSSGHNTADIPPVADFDLKKYMGRWYEIARMPISFERGIYDAQADYTLLPDGTVKVINSGFRNGIKTSVAGVARTGNVKHSGELEVSFFYPFFALYKVIYVDKDYTLAIVTGSSMDSLWILARKPVISRSEMAMCLEMLKKWGFAVKLLQYPSGMVESLTLPIETK